MTTFTKDSPGTYDAESDTFTSPTSDTVTGSAIKVRAKSSEVEQYRALGLVLAETVTLFFTPDTYGDTPALGSTVEWADVTYTVRTVDTIAPDGVTIAARLGVSR
jgi:hypothetical protein